VKKSILLPISLSLLLATVMISHQYGFTGLVNDFVTSLDYMFLWALSPVDIAMIVIVPWLAYYLLQTEEKRTLANQLGLNILYLISSLVFFTFGFLLISMNSGDNPLVPQYVKMQPFDSYWSVWFIISHILVTIFYYINKRQKSNEQ